MNRLLENKKGFVDNSFFGYLIFSAFFIFMVSKFISAGNFTGITKTVIDILPLALVGLVFYFLFVTSRV